MDVSVVGVDLIELVLSVAEVLNERIVLRIVHLKYNFGVREFGKLDGFLQETDSSLLKGHSTESFFFNFLNLNLFSSHSSFNNISAVKNVFILYK